jgi:hypothetical protein
MPKPLKILLILIVITLTVIGLFISNNAYAETISTVYPNTVSTPKVNYSFCIVSNCSSGYLKWSVDKYSKNVGSSTWTFLGSGASSEDNYIYNGVYGSSDVSPATTTLNKDVRLDFKNGANGYNTLASTTVYMQWINGVLFLNQISGVSTLPPTNTRIISVSPENNVNIVPLTQSSTTKYAPFDIDLLEYYNSASTSSISYITTTLTNKDIPAFTYTKTLLDFATGTATTSYTVYEQVPFGLYDYTIRLFDINLDVIDATTTTNIQFGSTTLPSITFEDIYGSTTTQIYTATEQSIISYINLINLLKTKAPFGYFYIVRDSLSNINTNGTSTVNIVIPAHLKTYFFNPIDLGLSGILWFYFIIFFYKRLKHITI